MILTVFLKSSIWESISGILTLVIVYLVYKFISDRNANREKIEKKGGLSHIYPTFVSAIDILNEVTDLDLTLSKSTSDLLEYRTDKFDLNGYFLIALRYDFRMYISVDFMNDSNKRENGYFHEFPKDRKPTVTEYIQAILSIINKIATKPGFTGYQIDSID